MPSGVAGVCLSRAAYAQDAAVITSTCGGGLGKQQWRIGRHAVRDGDYCLAVASPSKTAAARLRRCNGSAYQQWTALGNGLLRNTLAGRPARPEQHGHPGHPGQRGFVHHGRVARLVAPLSHTPGFRRCRVQRPGSVSGRAAPSDPARLAEHGTAL